VDAAADILQQWLADEVGDEAGGDQPPKGQEAPKGREAPEGVAAPVEAPTAEVGPASKGAGEVALSRSAELFEGAPAEATSSQADDAAALLQYWCSTEL